MSLISLILAALLLSSCMAKPEENENYESDTEAPFVPATDEGNKSELYEKYIEMQENSSVAFKENQPNPAEDFKVEISDEGIKLIEYIGKSDIVVVPELIDEKAVVSVAKNAFSDKNVRAVSIPRTVKNIEKSAFENCDTLVTLRVPFVGDGGENSFAGYIFGGSRPDENTVKLPASLEMLIIDGDVEKIDDNSFAGCKNLEAIILPDSVCEIGELAFYECFDLVYISFGSGVEKLGEYSFAYCQSLYAVDCMGAEEIGKGTFYSCRSLNNITLPFVGKSLEENRFLGYIFGAETADFNDEFVPSSLRRVIIGEGCLNIPDRAFTSCERLTEVVLPEGIVDIGIRAFYKCRSLIGAELPESLVSVGDDAFFMCESLSSVSFGNKLESLGMQAFYGCNSLGAVSLPEGLTELLPLTFYGCSSLSDVELGGVKRIGKDAFAGCDRLDPLDLNGVEYENEKDK